MKGYLFILLLFFSAVLRANNLQIYNVSLKDAAHLQFNISWENAWNLDGQQAPSNHDAAWIFIKYSKDGGPWMHLNLDTDSLAYLPDTNLNLKPAKDGKGLFVKLKRTGASLSASGSISIAFADSLLSGNYRFRVMGTEMVYVNKEAYYLGDHSSYYTLKRGDGKPLYINSENEIAIGKDTLSLLDTGTYAPEGKLPLPYPKGYEGFYIMKYEISQEQYVAFLNCLSLAQQKTHTVNSPEDKDLVAMGGTSAGRNGITVQIPGETASAKPAIYAMDANANKTYNEEEDGGNRACNFLTWADVSAYLDWAALRPFTELEYEKACRGPKIPIKDELCWGTSLAVDANTIMNDATDSEAVSDIIPSGYGICSYGYIGPLGPLRCGFAANAKSDRLKSGAAYYGAMEMSGNLWELCINLTKAGLVFDSKHGDGELNTDGFADVSNWPSNTSGEGAGFRGGAFYSGIIGPFRDPAISSRFYITLSPMLRRNTVGGRGARKSEK